MFRPDSGRSSDERWRGASTPPSLPSVRSEARLTTAFARPTPSSPVKTAPLISTVTPETIQRLRDIRHPDAIASPPERRPTFSVFGERERIREQHGNRSETRWFPSLFFSVRFGSKERGGSVRLGTLTLAGPQKPPGSCRTSRGPTAGIRNIGPTNRPSN